MRYEVSPKVQRTPLERPTNRFQESRKVDFVNTKKHQFLYFGLFENSDQERKNEAGCFQQIQHKSPSIKK